MRVSDCQYTILSLSQIERPPASDLGDDLVLDYSTRTFPTLETDSAHYAGVKQPVSAPSAPRPPSSSCIYSAVNIIQSDMSRPT